MSEQYNPYQQPQQPQAPYGAAPQQPMPQQVNVTIDQQPQQPVERVMYAVSDSDRTLRLVNFIFMILSIVAMGWMIIPLAWLIPMTVISWGIYKGTKPNSTAFAICTLLFASLIGGICLLISTKNK